MSASQLSKIKNTISGIFEKAEANDLIVKSPARSLEKPNGTKGELRALTEKERDAFIKTSYKHDKGLLFCITLACGLRPGEARALKWENVDFEKMRINVNEAIESGKNTEKSTKTQSGVRIIPMPLWFADRLKSFKKDVGYVFPSSATNKVLTVQNFYRSWNSFKRLMDIEMGATLYRNKVVKSFIDEELTPYYLRHTNVLKYLCRADFKGQSESDYRKAEDYISRLKAFDESCEGRPKFVYVCSPYQGDVEANTQKAILYCKTLIKEVYIPIAPHLYFPLFFDDNTPEERATGLGIGKMLLVHCDKIIVFGDNITDGMKGEIRATRELGIAIEYKGDRPHCHVR